MNQAMAELPRPIRFLVKLIHMDKALSTGMKNQSRAAQKAEGTGDAIAQTETAKNMAITLAPDLAVIAATRGILATGGGQPEKQEPGEQENPGGPSSRDTSEETRRVQHATSEESADNIMKDKNIDPSTDGFVHTKETETPGQTKSPSQLGDESGAKSTQKVIEFDRKPSDRTFTPDLTDDTLFPGPVDLSDRNPIVIDPPSDD